MTWGGEGGECKMQFGLNMSLIVRLTQLLSHMLKSQITFPTASLRRQQAGAVLQFLRSRQAFRNSCPATFVSQSQGHNNNLASSHVSACLFEHAQPNSISLLKKKKKKIQKNQKEALNCFDTCAPFPKRQQLLLAAL